jgi:hypothetical protein
MTGAITTQNAGSFQIVEEKDTSSFRAMHVPYGWTKLRLLFTTADRLAYVLLEDDGGGVTIQTRVPTCFSSSRYYQYGDREDESHLYDAMAGNFHGRLRTCPTQIAAADEYEQAFRRASADFPEAIRLFKARAVAVFGGLKPRCRTPEPQPYPSADLYRPCQ